MSQTVKSKKGQQGQNKIFLRRGFPYILVAVLILSGVVFWLSCVFAKETERYTFVTQSILNILIFAGILTQALIYRRQWDAMQEGLALTERAAKATENSVAAVREANAPYFGIRRVSLLDFQTGYKLRVSVSFMNGGRTPAWHFTAVTTLIFGNDVDDGERFSSTLRGKIDTTFIPTGEETTIEYQSEFTLTQERLKAITNHDATLFVVIKTNYFDMRNVEHPSRTFERIFDPDTGRLGDYYGSKKHQERKKKTKPN